MQEECRRRQKAAQERMQRKLNLTENIEEHMKQWFQAHELEKYIQELEYYASQKDNSEEQEMLFIYIALVKEKAALKNPIKRIIDEIKFIGEDALSEDDAPVH